MIFEKKNFYSFSSNYFEPSMYESVRCEIIKMAWRPEIINIDKTQYMVVKEKGDTNNEQRSREVHWE